MRVRHVTNGQEGVLVGLTLEHELPYGNVQWDVQRGDPQGWLLDGSFRLPGLELQDPELDTDQDREIRASIGVALLLSGEERRVLGKATLRGVLTRGETRPK